MSLDKHLLRQNLDLVVGFAPRTIEYFYRVLFERHPEARPLFHRRSLEEQQLLLFDALAWCVNHLDDWGELGRVLVPLGELHEEYGVTPEMYEWVGDALIDTLAHISGTVWDDELERSWREAYAILMNVMLAGCTGEAAGTHPHAASAPPPSPSHPA